MMIQVVKQFFGHSASALDLLCVIIQLRFLAISYRLGGCIFFAEPAFTFIFIYLKSY